jgi:hypothetical protein
MLKRLWNDEAGFIVSAELVLIATILVIGMIVGLVSVRDQVVQELADVAGAIAELNQSYSFSGITGHTSATAGSEFADETDFCDELQPDDPTGGAPVCVNVTVTQTEEGQSL